MKKCIIYVTVLFICACAAKPTVKKSEPLPPVSLAEIPTQTLKEDIVSPQKSISPLFGKLILKVSTAAASFNPAQGKKVSISCILAKPAKVTMNVYDPDQGLIKTITSDKNNGENTIVWDGKDMDGNVVPDEAYFFTIIAKDKAGSREIYDPTTFSGGEEHDITKADINRQSQTINYKMPEMGRVMIRMGIQGGALLNTLVDWKPRIKGVITEYWNGKDKDNLIDLYDNPKFKMIVAYFTLPENTVITFGNKKQTYREYKKASASSRPIKPKRAAAIKKVSHHYHLPRTADYAPNVKMTLSNIKRTDSNGIPVLKGKTMVKVDLDERDKHFFTNQQFEICFFLDNEFYAEDESGYTPFNWVWDLSNVKEGEHILTVNLTGFKDQIGMLSRKVKVIK